MRKYSSARVLRKDAVPFASASDWAACRASLCGGSRTFYAASLVLPAGVRQAATGLYAFCRMADDAIDQGTDRHGALADLRCRLTRIYAGAPDTNPADRAFADVVARYSIPKAFPDALLEGFEWDAMNRRYETIAELNAYGVRVAGVVGAMMAMVMGVREPRLIARACDLGAAMQLTNIARDVGEDALHGRLYLPLQWMREAHIDPQAWSAAPVFSDALAAVIRRLLAEADALYVRSEIGIAQLPAACRPGMYAARLLYAEIGHELRRRGLDSVTQRTVVPWQRKARLLAEALAAATARGSAELAGDMLPQAGFLLESLPGKAALHTTAAVARGRASRRGITDRVVWVVDLFERLERVDRGERSGRVLNGLS